MLDGKTVLILDDRPLIATGVEQAVHDLRGQPVTYAHRRDVLETLQSDDELIHIAVLDERSVGNDQLPILRLLRDKSIPLILVTSNSVTTKTGLAAYASIILQKPVGSDELTDALRALA